MRASTFLCTALLATGASGQTAVVPIPRPAVPTEEALRARLSELLAAPTLHAASIGALVADVATGRVLFARDESLLLNPASNVKLATTAAALALLGPEYRFRTVLAGERRAGGPSVRGNLYLRGMGDPTLVTESLHAIAGELRAAGIRDVEGALVVDDRFFDPPPFTQDDAKPEADAGYRAPCSALSLNYNTVRVVVHPGPSDGADALLAVVPGSDYFKVTGRVTTVPRGAARIDVRALPQLEQTELSVNGRVPLGASPVEVRKRVVHPARYAGHTLLRVLARYGITVADRIVRTGETPPGLAVLVSRESEPLSVLVRDINKVSSNVMANQLLLAIGAERRGAPGTFAKGIEAIEEHLASIGIPRRGFHLASGSGLDSETRLDAITLVAILRAAARDFRYSADLLSSLAVAGADGTLARRMAGSPAERYVRAKTGTLQGVVALSGYAAGPRRGLLAFAVMINGTPAGSDARRTVDDFAAALASYLSR